MAPTVARYLSTLWPTLLSELRLVTDPVSQEKGLLQPRAADGLLKVVRALHADYVRGPLSDALCKLECDPEWDEHTSEFRAWYDSLDDGRVPLAFNQFQKRFLGAVRNEDWRLIDWKGEPEFPLRTDPTAPADATNDARGSHKWEYSSLSQWRRKLTNMDATMQAIKKHPMYTRFEELYELPEYRAFVQKMMMQTQELLEMVAPEGDGIPELRAYTLFQIYDVANFARPRTNTGAISVARAFLDAPNKDVCRYNLMDARGSSPPFGRIQHKRAKRGMMYIHAGWVPTFLSPVPASVGDGRVTSHNQDYEGNERNMVVMELLTYDAMGPEVMDFEEDPFASYIYAQRWPAQKQTGDPRKASREDL